MTYVYKCDLRKMQPSVWEMAYVYLLDCVLLTYTPTPTLNLPLTTEFLNPGPGHPPTHFVYLP